MNHDEGRKRKRSQDDEHGDSVSKRKRVSDNDEEDEDDDTVNIIPEVNNEVSDDEDEVDSDEEDEENKNRSDVDKIEYIDNEHANNVFQLIHGDAESIEELEAHLRSYTKDDWRTLAESLLHNTIDTNCSNRDLMMTFQLFYRLFCFPFEGDYAVIDRIRAIYPHITSMHDQYKKIQHLFGVLNFELEKRGMLETDTREGREVRKQLTQIAFGMKMTFEQLVVNRLIQKGTDKSMRAMLEEMKPESFFSEINLPKQKPIVQLLHFYYREAFKNSYRKDGDCIYKPMYNKYGEFVHAYEYVCEISDFVFQSLFPLEENHYWFECLMASSSNAQHCIKMLTNLKSEWLKELVRNKDVHAFQNGLFILSLNSFFHFKKIPDRYWVGNLTGNLIAVKYHDMIFDEEGMEKDMNSQKVRTYMSIKMEHIHTIFDTQNFKMIERQWILALLGRMLHPLGSKDTWGVFPYFLGLAGTGKSSLLRLTASLYEARDVGYLNNALQKTFALEGIYDKLMYMALDIDEHFQLDQTTFQSMVVGEEVAVLRKYKRPITVIWNIHGGFAGNKLPPWTDNGGSLSRRLIVIEFLKLVDKCDPNLFQKCLKQKDRFLKVCNSAYHDMTQKYGHRGIKEVIPEKFKKSERQALLELNTLMAFIRETCDIDQKEREEKTFVQPFKDFNKAFKIYCKQNSIKGKTLNHNFYSGVFAKFQVSMENPVQLPDKSYKFGQTERYVWGLKLKDNILEEISNQ